MTPTMQETREELVTVASALEEGRGWDPGRDGHTGLTIRRRFTTPEKHPFDLIQWDERTAEIRGEKGEVVFEEKGVEFPSFWSQIATNVVVSKYFRGSPGTPERERSVKQLLTRVTETVGRWGREDGYFATEEDAASFEDELTHLLLHQYAAFNSPVWFNLGIEPKPQCSACFINSVEDSMEGIMDLARTEALLFKYGSGTGTNLSPLRSSKESLKGGGMASGPVSFMRGFDAFAGVIKSGGKTRRAAKMVILDASHPDLFDFIDCKWKEEKKAWSLVDVGYDGSVNGEAYSSVFFQNSNNSVRVTDSFMDRLLAGGEWELRAVRGGEVLARVPAGEVMERMARAAHACGDPGIQFDDAINRWHTCPATDRIRASNPCVAGETQVATSVGWRRIDELVGRSVMIIGSDGLPHPVEKVFPTGRKPIFELSTRAGYRVRITGDHRVRTTERGDVAVKDLTTKDRIFLAGPGFGRRTMSADLAVGVGVAVGDGCLTRSIIRGRTEEIVILTMHAEEAGILASIAAAVNHEKSALKAVGSIGRNDGVQVSRSATGSRLSFASGPVVDLFRRMAVLDEGSERKRFTPEVFELDKPALSAVLRGLFTSDGTVANYGDKSQYVSLDSTSLELLRQVQILLLGFGIKAKIYENRRGGANSSILPDGKGGSPEYPVQEMHSLRISRSSRFLFEREIGFHPLSPKAELLAELNSEVAAYQDELSDEVASVTPAGEEEVFDLTEEATHHFVAGGLVVHNCSEYMFLDDSACNLASINLLRCCDANGHFDPVVFRHACEIVFTAQEILVDRASYPTEKIARNSRDFRPIGLGYANLGALLLRNGIAYDSEEGRAWCGAITALMTGAAYTQSARISRDATGPFPGYGRNRTPFLGVMRMHRDSLGDVSLARVPADLAAAARASWEEAVTLGEEHGYRNAQATVLAPTGTIAFLMDCDTTGIEPDIALVKYKRLSGGGMLKIINQSVPQALTRLGYAQAARDEILSYIERQETIEGAPHLKDDHLSVFDCAFRPTSGTRSIAPMGHVRMMAAAQPFLSGAISKTVNMSAEATIEEIRDVYIEAWKLGLKSIAVYRDGCKRSQPLSTSKAEEKAPAAAPAEAKPSRRRLPAERRSITHRFELGGHEGYITVGLFEDGTPGEIFLTMSKEGSTISGLMDTIATLTSISLQYGVPIGVLIEKFSHARFEPSGYTKNEQIPIAKSLVDYVFRWLAAKFLDDDRQRDLGIFPAKTGDLFEKAPAPTAAPASESASVSPATSGEASAGTRRYQADAPSCSRCGGITVRSGSCYLCANCGTSSGCS